jgi:amino acid adenylation domain-containing protein
MPELTSTQRDIYLEGKIFGQVINNIGGYQKYPCAIDEQRFVRARDVLVQSNDAYGLRFKESDGTCIVLHEAYRPSTIELMDFTEKKAPTEAAHAWIQERFETAFCDLETVVFEDALLRISETEYWYYAKAHHLIMDGTGLALQMKRLIEIYQGIQPLPESPQSPSFRAYMQRKGASRSAPSDDRDRSYWLERHAGRPAPMFEVDGVAERTETAMSGRVSVHLPDALFRSLADIGKQVMAHASTVFQAILFVYFARAWQRDDITIGTPVHNRRDAAERKIIGSLVNTQACRIRCEHESTFLELVRHIVSLQKRDYRHSRYPIGEVVRALRTSGEDADSPLYEVAFNYQQLDFDLRVDDRAVETHFLTNHRERTPATLVLCDYGPDQRMVLHLDYGVRYFDSAEANATLSRIVYLATQVATDPYRAIREYAVVTPAEWNRQVVEWNATDQPVREHMCLHQWFEEQAAATPDRTALVHHCAVWSYQQLDERAQALAGRMWTLGAGRGSFIAICMRRTPDLIAAILAVLKTGATYVPVDPAYPDERKKFILEDTSASIVVVDGSVDPKIFGRRSLLDVREPCALAHLHPSADSVEAEDLAYVIYTSGSTGRPKGVLIEHRNASSLVEWARDVFTETEVAGVLAATSVCFDLSIFEIFVPLSMGGSVVLVDNLLDLRDGAPGPVSLINTVPSAIRPLLDAGAIPDTVCAINLAGEALAQDLVEQIHAAHSVKLRDLYGPSEDTTYSTCAVRRPNAAATIGRPIANTRAYVLDRHGAPLPVGRVGELHLAGNGLARGYLNQEALTGERFVFNPHVNERVYRTGDLVRLDAHGALEYVGRKDEQVKIRGYRVEPGEIEAEIRKQGGIRACAVIAVRDELQQKQLVAYAVAGERAVDESNGEQALIDTMREELMARLPSYMVPAHVVFVDELPLTPNGKLDRDALSRVRAGPASTGVEYKAPRTETERRLAACWQGLLRGVKPGVFDNFFRLGGDSLSLLRLAGVIETEFGVRLELSTLFDQLTLEAQARLIEQHQGLLRLLAEVAVDGARPLHSHIDL